MRKILLALIAGLILTLQHSSAQPAVSESIGNWIRTSFAKGKEPPFSFTYGGVRSSSFIKKWRHSITRTPSERQIIKYTVSYSDPSTGLRVDCDITGYEDYDAVDWVVRFTNKGSVASPAIKDVRAVDYSYSGSRNSEISLQYIKGSEAKIDDFSPRYDKLEIDSVKVFHPERGRSSDGMAAPYFNLISSDGKGLVLAIGWTGTWTAEFERMDLKHISVKGGMKTLDTYLNAGESIRTPLISMMFWSGRQPMAGNNKFRRFMLEHNIRKVNGQDSVCPVFAGIGWSDPAPFTVRTGITSEIAICNIHRFQQFGLHPDVFWMDAGWYTRDAVRDRRMNWHYTSGTWRPDPERFPYGLRPISDEAHRSGAKFLVWFEPERANKGSQVWSLHPEWLLSKPGDDFYYMFNMGDRDALEWMCSHIGDFIEESGIDFYRQDLCLEPSDYWETNDKPGRTGMTELRHIEGLYDFLDYLHKRFPSMLIDNCASGGRRLDIEMFRRSVPLWRTDYFNENRCEGAQCHSYGLNFFIPVHGISIKEVDDYSFLSTISSTTVFNVPLFNNPKLDLDVYRSRIDLFRQFQPYFYEDYYPLSGVRDLTGFDVCLAYQFHKSSDGTGIILAFRRKDAAKDSLDLKIEALDSDTRYVLTDVLRDESYTLYGSEMSEGLRVVLDNAPGAVLYRYVPEELNNLAD